MASNDAFISYRRSTSGGWAQAVYVTLREKIDVFFDVESIGAGQFWEIIEAQIRARPYFIPLLSPSSLRRCREPDDLLLKELRTAADTKRRIVPLTTTEFDRGELDRDLPAPLAKLYAGANGLSLDNENFTATMEKLVSRFLTPIEITLQPLSTRFAKTSATLQEGAADLPPPDPFALNAQRHFDRALSAAPTDAELAAQEFELGSNLLAKSSVPDKRMEDFNLLYLELQQNLQRSNAEFERISAVMKTMHDNARQSIRAIR